MPGRKFAWCLFFLRISVFAVFAVWTLDKFLNPEHTAKVFQKYYFIDGLTETFSFVIGACQAIVIIGFVMGLKKSWTYTLVLVMHAISTVASYKAYIHPFQGPHLLFYAALPMLAACLMLWSFKNADTLFTLNTK